MRKYDVVTVLLVEDNSVDVEAVSRAFRKHRIANPLNVAGDGLAALEALRRPPDADDGIPRPCLILLDLNLPRMGGIEFLREVRADPALRSLVVFVLTTSTAEEDMVESYDLNVAGYAVKSRVGEDFIRLIDMLDAYWKVIELPKGKGDLQRS